MVKLRITNWEGIAMNGPSIDPLSGKLVKLNNSFEKEADLFYNKLPLELRDTILNNQELADNLYSYSYNVGSNNFEKRVVPALIDYYYNNGTVLAVLDSMYAKGDSKLRGLAKRREYEKKQVQKNLPSRHILYIPQQHIEHPDKLRVLKSLVFSKRQGGSLYEVNPESFLSNFRGSLHHYSPLVITMNYLIFMLDLSKVSTTYTCDYYPNNNQATVRYSRTLVSQT